MKLPSTCRVRGLLVSMPCLAAIISALVVPVTLSQGENQGMANRAEKLKSKQAPVRVQAAKEPLY